MFGPCKYLLIHPFSPLSIAKSFSCISYALCVIQWQLWVSIKDANKGILFLTPVVDLVCLAILLISLWFTLQKFYWKKLEVAMNSVGLALCMFTTATLLIRGDPSTILGNIQFAHVLLTISWIFCVIWSHRMTENTVSNLFISNWGEATEEVEIDALENHF